ncbi:EAL domain-containing protein [bacterium]|nr:EAL domain-containing protein [bacterium]
MGITYRFFSKVVFVQLSLNNYCIPSFKRLILLCAVFLFSNLCINQVLASSVTFDENIKFQHLTAADGLSQNDVFDIVQDQEGFIWIATGNGLNRYDGHDIIHYKKDISDPNSIADNVIRKLFIDTAGDLWIGTAKGISVYNSQKDNFNNYYPETSDKDVTQNNIIWDIYQDNQGFMWISTEKGLHKLDTEENKFVQQRIRGLEDTLVAIKTIFQDHLGNYWLGTYDHGIYVVNNSFSYAFSLNDNTNKWSLSLGINTLYDLKEIDNNYWLATDKGLIVVNKNHEIVKTYTQESRSNKIISNSVRSISILNDSHVWVGTELGLNIINLGNNEITSLEKSHYSMSLSENWIIKIFQDQNGRMLIGTFGEGLNIFNLPSYGFKHRLNVMLDNEINSFAETSDKRVWFHSTDNFLYFLDDNNLVKKSPIQIEDSILEMIAGDNNTLWLLSYTGNLYQVNTNDNSILTFKDWESKANHFSENKIIYTDITNETRLWFIDNDSNLTAFDPNNNEFTRFSMEQEDINLRALTIEKSSLWSISSDNQLIHFNLNNNKFSEISIPPNNLFPIEDIRDIAISKGWMWLTSNHGAMLYDRKNKSNIVFNESNQLKNNNVLGVLLDDDENAWLSSDSAISMINPNTAKVKNYSSSFNLTDSQFIQGSFIKSTNNYMYFGGMRGFYQFDPAEVLAQTQQPKKPVLTTLLIANKVVENNNDKQNIFSLPLRMNNLESLTLQHAQTPFSIEFVSPNTEFSNQTSYRFRLKGYEENWIETDNDNRRATYTNISAGNYVFEAQIVDNLSGNNSEIKSLNIHILPPWWLSNGAILIYTIIGLLIFAYFLQQLRHKRLYHMQIKLSEERLKLSLWGSGDEMWDWNIVKGKIYRSNIWGILEFPQDGTRNVGNGNGNETNIHQKDIARISEALEDHFADKTEHFEATYRVKDKDDKWIWVLDRGKVVERDNQDKPTRMTGTLKDISQIKKADERLKLFAKCIQNISDAVVIYDRQFHIVDVNKSFQRITGKSKKQMVGTLLKFGRYPERFTTEVMEHLLRKGGWHGEIESKRENGEVYLTDLSIDIIFDENNAISHFVGVFSDITKRKETESELRRLANSDTLTGLPNRSYFQANQARLVKKKVSHALLVFDLDNFKKVNDSMGHEVGDVLLCKVAQRMRTVGRKKDTVYRLGGDEFSILIEDTNDIHTITTIAKNILTTIAQPLKLKSQEIVLFSSIGIVLYPEDGISPQELLKNADTAMYHAKHSGGNKYQFFNDSMNKKAVKRLQIENLIRHGLKEDFFSVFYQPKIEISTGKVAGMEALVRFETPGKGIISPVVFIPVSEETGQIIGIGEIVLRKACYATKAWIDAGLFDGRVAVNLSAVQFTQHNLVGMISDILKESQLPAKYLELEITEGTVMDSPQKAIETMLQIRAMGIHLSLDDFGTGYSSLAYLKKFPLNTLKIDKAFVDDIEESEQGRNMVATIVTIAHNLGLHVVAEGVETNNQLSFLSGLRCEQLQGYLYSKPLPEKDFRSYLLSHQITDKSTSFIKPR